MAQTQLTCSVVICAYTEARWRELTVAVKSVGEQSVQPIDIIVVIDHNPQLLEHARSCLVDATVVENHYERGLSGARNSGIAVAQGDVIAFLDDDAIAAVDWLERLLEHYTKPNVIGVGGSIVPHWETIRPFWFPEEFDWVVGCTYRGMPEAEAPVRNLIGANMSFRRNVFQQVTGFRSSLGRIGTLPMGCEETELCIQLHKLQPTSMLLYCPQASVLHLVPATRGSWAYFCARCYAEGRSKALVSQLVGSSDGLASERSYILHTLPRGMFTGVMDALGGDFTGLERTGTIAAGLAITVTGYVTEILLRVLRQGPILRSHAAMPNGKS